MTTQEERNQTIDGRWLIGTAVAVVGLQLSVLGSVVTLYSRIATIETTINYISIQQTRYDEVSRSVAALQQHVAILENNTNKCQPPQQP